MITRRTALMAGASALVVAGCGGRQARTIAGDPADLHVLSSALDLEREQIAFYESGLQLRTRPQLQKFLAQERAHAAAIEEAIRELGGTPAPPRPIARYSVSRGFDAWRQDAILREEQWSAAYAKVIPRLANPRLRATLGAIMTTEAEHAVALDAGV